MISIKDRKILGQIFSHYDYVMTTAQLSKEKLYFEFDMEAIPKPTEQVLSKRPRRMVLYLASNSIFLATV